MTVDIIAMQWQPCRTPLMATLLVSLFLRENTNNLRKLLCRGSLSTSYCFLSTGDICPMGTYCEPGSYSPSLCPPGTYLNTTGNDALADCITCTAGYYCASPATEVPDGKCTAGWYCPGGQEVPTPLGYNCTTGEMEVLTILPVF